MFKFVYFFAKHKISRLLGVNNRFQSLGLRFCLENNIDAHRVHKDQIFGIHGSFNGSELANQINALVIPKRKRFGNALLQLADAYNIARHLGIKKIYHRGYSFLNDVAMVEGVEFVKGVPRRSENYMIGDYYQNNDLLQICTDKLDRWQIMHAMAKHMTLAMAPNDNSEQEQKSLYIHLRSGDIFKKTPPHRDYGQPPLAFYQKIIRSQPWTKVYLVFEDQFNPVIPALQDFLKTQGITYQTHSGDIHQDIEVLLRAKHLVIARGTFIYPILCISQNIQQVFYFEVDEHSLWGLQHSPIAFHKYLDAQGTYRNTILTDWKNDAEQNRRMLEYPESSVVKA